MYIAVAAVAQRFNFRFEDAKAEEIECTYDNFAIGTRGRDVLRASATRHERLELTNISY